MLAVHFGAGNIGRGFIGHILADAGFEVVFADINNEIIDALKAADSYTVHYAEEAKRSFDVTGFRALHSADEREELVSEIASADMITTAVGATILKHIAPTIVDGLRARRDSAQPLFVIACENAVNGTDILRAEVEALLSTEEQEELLRYVSFLNAGVDRIVPIQSLEKKVDVLVEPFHEWTVDVSGAKSEVPSIEGIHFVEELAPFIERKLFTVNTGHAAAAYHGYLAGHETVQQAMQDAKVRAAIEAALADTSALLTLKHGFDAAEHQEYVQTILSRFENTHLTDEITRVARQPIKKLGSKERLVSPALQLVEIGKEPTGLSSVIGAVLHYDVSSDEEAVKLQEMIQAEGKAEAFASVAGLTVDHKLVKDATK
ncbi:mannitol-1-phosphate 5-dehydrogenase [Paenalkalicoccus suaedae]|uniref:Mannitol-1-phosphate 5-dehydrogenase n=1 Tax=Paenalkalicoccus suaedae TaxID=2592382 RepID=A0A859FA95_9BACI|nr:mannitol-1-phosphate 5-dehydrogenase [Paenalkalicoccus suaedae]QKS69837.1 mannitol-1-phosphate 5-dehydrogenase [Paenalkalicoccus suaedae]